MWPRFDRNDKKSKHVSYDTHVATDGMQVSYPVERTFLWWKSSEKRLSSSTNYADVRVTSLCHVRYTKSPYEERSVCVSRLGDIKTGENEKAIRR